MYVVKRDGRPEAVHFDKITARLKKLSYGLSQEHCDPVLVAQKVCAGVYKGVTTSQLDELAAETAAAMTANHPDYASVCPAFVFFDAPSFPFLMYHHFNERSGQEAPLIADDVYDIIMKSNGQWSLFCPNEAPGLADCWGDEFEKLYLKYEDEVSFCDFRTVWEIKQRTLVDMAVDRGCYIDQSQSLNIHMDQPNFGKLTSLHFYAWSKGLKTGMYYLRSRAAADAIKFTVDTSLLQAH
ncbi:hypothetical protein B296_00001926, partial [Ensete ventricosum]